MKNNRYKYLKKYIKKSSSKKELLEFLCLKPSGSNYRTIDKLIIEENLDISHFENLINKISSEDFSKIILESNSFSNALKKCGLRLSGNNFIKLKKRIEKDKLDTSHFLGRGQKGTKKNKPFKSLKDILVKGSFYQSNCLKKRLISEKILKYECAFCGIYEWMGKKLTLRLDHINGHKYDNRLKNLRLLCPNCDSQTDTYCGKNKGKLKSSIP